MRPLDRRSLLRGAVGGVLGTTAALAEQTAGPARVARERRRGDGPRGYKVIYNWDGAPHGYSEFPQSLEAFLDKTFAPLKDTQVGALFWCLGEHEATWNSKTLPVVGDSQDRFYESVRSMRHNENIRAMIQRGENPFQAMVQRGHELGIDVYASIRMNDNHFRGLQLEDMPKTRMEGLTQFRKDHSEWCLGPERAPPWFAASWNMAIPEVREHRFTYIREALAQADWDGVELDWQRHGFHLPVDDAYRLRYTLTDLQRAVRQRTNNLAKKRGRPFHVAVRVATTMESCRRIGYDLKTWIDEGLCDIITAGGGAGTDPGIEVEAFSKLVDGTPIQFYTGFDGGPWGAREGLAPADQWQRAWFRGHSQAYWRRGADGIYVFNWHANERTRRDLLTSVGADDTLAGTDKVFAALHRHVAASGGDWAGADLNDRIVGETPVALHPTLTETGPQFHVGVYDDVVAHARAGGLKSAELRIEIDQFSPADRLRVMLDGKSLNKPAVRYASRQDASHPSDVGGSSWLVWSLSAGQVDFGNHEVKIHLLRRNRRVKAPLVVRHVEIHVSYV